MNKLANYTSAIIYGSFSLEPSSPLLRKNKGKRLNPQLGFIIY